MANNTFEKIYQNTSGYLDLSDKDLILLYSEKDKEVKSIQLSSLSSQIEGDISDDQKEQLLTNIQSILDKLNS